MKLTKVDLLLSYLSRVSGGCVCMLVNVLVSDYWLL